MHIKQKLEILKNYYGVTRAAGHTTLVKKGTENYDRPKLILAYTKMVYDEVFNCKSSEIVSWNNLNDLKGNNKPLAIDNAVMQKMLDETLNYINELEMYKEQLNDIRKIIEKEYEIRS